MKHLLFLKNLITEDDARKVRDALEGTRVEYEIILANQCVVIYGRNDIVHAAKVALSEYGFIVE
ncbi:hypothetical protein SDC9_102669 [bioreactor metagenome]|uniref:HMA domain-containing protein n=1 Tax=bioreactor metagenome TaxID=1076179 RepID=A0A645AUA5_9ZZZZ|nr:hypothetical protein [Erysipelotrichaceae bacterium]